MCGGGYAGRVGAVQLRDEPLEPRHELRPQVGPLAGQPDHRAQVVRLVPGVVAQAPEDDSVHRAARGQLLKGVGQLDLAAPARRGALQDAEDGRVEDVAPDDGVAARCVLPGRLLDQAGDADDVLLAGGFDGGAAVEVDLLRRDLQQGNHAAETAVAHVEHPAEQCLARVDQVVAEKNGEGLVADVPAGAQYGGAEAERVALPDVVDARQPARVADRVQP
ncbi:hypothetical protein GCM10011428_51860 [Streptomyces violaceus]